MQPLELSLEEGGHQTTNQQGRSLSLCSSRQRRQRNDVVSSSGRRHARRYRLSVLLGFAFVLDLKHTASAIIYATQGLGQVQTGSTQWVWRVAAMCISIPLFYLLPLLMYHFWNKVSVLKQGRSGGDWHLPGEVWNNVGPERLEAQTAKFTRDFAEHGILWQFAIWLRQFCLIVVSIPLLQARAVNPASISVSSQIVAVVGAILVHVVAAAATQYVQPFAFVYQNAVEQLLLLSNIVLLILALCLVLAPHTAYSLEVFMLVVVVGSLVAAIAHHVVCVLRRTLRMPETELEQWIKKTVNPRKLRQERKEAKMAKDEESGSTSELRKGCCERGDGCSECQWRN